MNPPINEDPRRGRDSGLDGASRSGAWPTLLRLPALAAALAALVGALWAGLARMGWPWPLPQPDLMAAHGPLMVSGFLGTMMGLERATSLIEAMPREAAARRRAGWLFVGPWLSAIGAVALLVGAPPSYGAGLMLLSALSLVAVTCLRLRGDPSLLNGVLVAGTLAWLFGNIHWAVFGQPIYEVVWLWMAFLVASVTAEQLMLSVGREGDGAASDHGAATDHGAASPPPTMRSTMPPTASPTAPMPASRPVWPLSGPARFAYLASLALLFAGAAAPAHGWPEGVRVAGIGALMLGGWMIGHDPALKASRSAGWSGYAAVAALLAYVWLTLGGSLIAAREPAQAGLAYDAMLHAVFVGLVFSMFFAHVPTVLPAQLGQPLAFRRSAWLPLALLQGSLALRLAGDFGAGLAARQWGGLLNAVALLALLSTLALSVVARAASPSRYGS